MARDGHTPTVLREQRILVCGGSGTLASAFVDAARDSGATIALLDLPSVADIRETDSRDTDTRDTGDRNDRSGAPFRVAADVTKIDELEHAFSAVRDHLGGIDTVVNFAGVHHRPYELHTDDPASLITDFRRVIEVNLVGAFAVTVVAARLMVPLRRGHIVHLCSNGSRAALYGSYAYNASKHGVEGIVRTAAAQLAPYGVRVNGIAPGTVVTDLNRSLLYDDTGEIRSRARSILSHTPTKRFATPEGVAESIVALCIPQRHLTGNVVFADDGYNIEGHTWPEGNEALYRGTAALDTLLQQRGGQQE
ncbi:MAG: SDR family NAD(P)-dependent oxidoreductase [Alkalispirochaeta sp.]